MENQEYLVREIKALSDSIRRKYRSLKQGVTERDRFIETTFKPVVAPLNDISNILKNQSPKTVEKDLGQGEKVEMGADYTSEEEETQTNDSASDDGMVQQDEDRLENSVEPEKDGSATISNRLSMLGQEIDSKGVLTRKYLVKMLHSTPGNRKYHVYGARMENEGMMIGDSLVETDSDDNLLIKGKTFKGTTGLFELVFKRTPLRYSTRDLNTFKSVLKLTNAHKKNYISGSNVHRNSSKKYINIIAKLFPPHQARKTTGKGISLKNTYDTSVIYYNNINKLAARMRLLYEAKQSGHTGVDNELIAITEEMRNRGYII